MKRRPEILAGNIARDDSTIHFYLRVNALLTPESVVLDLGAGRGAQLDALHKFRLSFTGLKGRVRELHGCDVDPVVLENRHLDFAKVIEPGQPLPYADGTFDVILCDWVLEHVEDPASFAAEVYRCLKPGGWFCARTPNKWGYIALMARLIPRAIERRILRRAQPGRQERDVFPKYYRINTLRAIRRVFVPSRWTDASFPFNATPAYHGGNSLVFDCIDAFQKLTPSVCNGVLFVYVQKQA